jgi:hypothetical protein
MAVSEKRNQRRAKAKEACVSGGLKYHHLESRNIQPAIGDTWLNGVMAWRPISKPQWLKTTMKAHHVNNHGVSMSANGERNGNNQYLAALNVAAA